MSEAQHANKLPSSLERARMAAQAIVDAKGYDVRVLDLREITQAFDFFVVGSGVSRRQLHAVSDEIDDLFEKKLGDKRRGIAGYEGESRWIVLDYGDVVVHLFDPETREFYALEDLWGKGKEIEIEGVTSRPSDEPKRGVEEKFDGFDAGDFTDAELNRVADGENFDDSDNDADDVENADDEENDDNNDEDAPKEED